MGLPCAHLLSSALKYKETNLKLNIRKRWLKENKSDALNDSDLVSYVKDFLKGREVPSKVRKSSSSKFLENVQPNIEESKQNQVAVEAIDAPLDQYHSKELLLNKTC